MTLERIISVGACLLVALGVGLGVREIGTPAQARVAALDMQRLHGLQELAQAINRSHRNPSLPLPLTVPDNLFEHDRLPVDPISREPYRYVRVDSKRYRLCARFAAATKPGPADGQMDWAHEATQTCYTITVAEDLPSNPPRTKS